MATQTLGEFAKTFEQNPATRNISDLKEVDTNMSLEDRSGHDKDGKEFKYKVVVVDGVDYRIPGTVIGSLKAILEKKPTLKKFAVSRQGKDKETTKYTVIPLD